MADQIVVMRDGRIEQAGAPLELYDNPANSFVATFIGSPAMNMLSGKVINGAEGRCFETDHGVRLPLHAEVPAEEGRRTLCGVRPEHFTLAESHHDDTIDMDVSVVEPTGAEALVIGRSGGQEFQAVFRERHEFKPGQKIFLAPKLDSLLLFDEETGLRIG